MALKIILISVNSQILMISKLGGEGVRQAPYTHLEAGSILDQPGAILADKYVSLGWFRVFLREKGSVVADKVIEPVDRY